MRKILVALSVLLSVAGTAHAQDYAACQLAGKVSTCPGNLRLKPGFFLQAAYIPWATPGTIGSTTPSTGSFTTLAATNGSGLQLLSASNIASGTLDVARLPTGIPAPSIAAGSVSNTVFGYIANLSSDAQAQLNGKQATLTLPLSEANGGFGASVAALGTGFMRRAGANSYSASAIVVADIASALASGGNPITGTVLTASTRTETSTIGTSSAAQHALPSGTAALLAADSSLNADNLASGTVPIARIPTGTSSSAVTIGNDTRLPPAPSTNGKIVIDSGSAYRGIAVTRTTYATNGTYSWSPAATTIRVKFQAWGGGGGGASGRQGTVALSSGGGGGSGGGYAEREMLVSEISAPVTLTVGAGGTGGAAQSSAATNGNAGNNATQSSVGTYLIASFGLGGSAGNTGTATSVAGRVSMFTGQTGGSAPINANGSTQGGGAGLGACGGGGGGGPIVASFGTGGTGGIASSFYSANGAGGSTVGAGGSDAPTTNFTGCGGGGGASGDASGTIAGGKGGNGGIPGGGGGGGGASVTGASSGAGGNGADGTIWVTEYPF